MFFDRATQGVETTGSGDRPQADILWQARLELCPEGIKVSNNFIVINRISPLSRCNQLFVMYILKLYVAYSPDSPGVGGSGHVFDTMALEIEQLLSKVKLILSCHFFNVIAEVGWKK